MRFNIVSLFFLSLAAVASAQTTENVILVTVDGLRHQELFGGADATILDSGDQAGIETLESVRAEFWRETPEERRRTLLPFFWSEIVPHGVVMKSRIANPIRNSFPGYSEILTGQVLPEISGNIDLQIPRETVLDIARRGLGVSMREVAAFTSWSHFSWIVEHEPGTIFVNAGYDDIPSALANPEMDRWGELQFAMRTPWDSVRHNAVTVGLALSYLMEHQPRVVFIALDETDEWAHARRYDRTLQAIQSFDQSLRTLWSTLQSNEHYRGRTTLIITTDHGRGRTPDDWISHGRDVEGCDETWIAILGPDTPARGISEQPGRNGQVAATVLSLLGLELTALGANAGPPLALAR
jgi:hypothetical protein